MDKTPEKKVLDAAIGAIRAHGIEARVLKQEAKRDLDFDARIEIRAQGKNIRPYVAEVKRHITNATLGAAVDQLRRIRGPALLVTDYVTTEVAEKLREAGVEFIDAAGNAHIQAPGVFVWVKGNRPPKGPEYELALDLRKRAVARAFEPAGIKILFAFLCIPSLVDRPYREIADKAGVAHGTVGWVMAELPHRGFLYDFGKEGGGRKLRQVDQLLTEWAAAYARKLKPTLTLGRYRARDEEWWRAFDPTIYDATLLGGEAAAARITRHLRPAMITVYADEVHPKLIVDQGLRADVAGNVEIGRRFWRFENPETKKGLTPLPLIYADLLATGDPRCIETAGLIRERYFAGLER